MKAKLFALVSTVSILLMFAISGWSFQQEGFSRIEPIYEKNYHVLHRQVLFPREDVNSFIVSQHNIFVYYDASALINVYSLDGHFEYGIQITTMKSGCGDIAFQNGFLYVKSHGAAIAVFQGEKLIEWLDYTNNSERYSTIQKLFDLEKNHSQGNQTYILSTNRSAILLAHSQRVVIAFPKRSRIAAALLIAGLLASSLSIRIYRKLVNN